MQFHATRMRRRERRPARGADQLWPAATPSSLCSRYLLQPTALECFMADRCSHALLNFASNQACPPCLHGLLMTTQAGGGLYQCTQPLSPSRSQLFK
jgi:hypothetical protein